MRHIIGLICCILIFLYAIQTPIRNYVWRTDISLWKDTVKKSPSHQLPHLNLATAYYKNKRYNEALKEYKRALEISPFKEIHIRNVIGKIYSMKGEYGEALEEFKKVIALDDQHVEIYCNMGLTYIYKGELNKATSYFQKAIMIDPEYHWSYYGLGLVYEKENRYNKAKLMFLKSLKLNPEFILAKQSLGRIQNK